LKNQRRLSNQPLFELQPNFDKDLNLDEEIVWYRDMKMTVQQRNDLLALE